MMVQLYKQPTRAPTRKKLWQDSAALVISLAFFAAGQFGVNMPPGFEAATVGVVGGWIGYRIHERVA